MPAYKPEECNLLLSEVIETEDLDAALALYEPDAIFVVSPDHVVTGHAAIREVLQGMTAANATGKLDAVTAVPSADGSVALAREISAAKATVGRRRQERQDLESPRETAPHINQNVRSQSVGLWRGSMNPLGTDNY